ncbi:MAG: 30S ribosomal protein S16 [Myxococcota bacterium]
MAVTIRLSRQGAKKHPFYRLMVADSRRGRDGKFLEWVGTYNPGTKPETLDFELDRINEWIKKGAQPSDTVRNLLKRHAARAPKA